MTEGEVFIVILFPAPRPVSEDLQFFSAPCATQTLTVTATKDGGLRLLVQHGAEIVAAFKSRPIRIVGGGYALLNASWRGDEIALRINGQDISASTEVAETPQVIAT